MQNIEPSFISDQTVNWFSHSKLSYILAIAKELHILIKIHMLSDIH